MDYLKVILFLLFLFYSQLNYGEEIRRTLEDIERALSNIEIKFKSLEKEVYRANPLKERLQVENRITDGNMFFRLKDYERAIILYTDVVENYPQSVAYPEALYYLAESLYQAREFIGAKRRFRQILDNYTDARFSPYFQKAFARYIELSIKLKSFEDVEEYLNKFIGMSPQDSSLESLFYFLGKYYYFKGELDRALNLFSRISPEGDYYPHSLYFTGVIYLSRGELNQALDFFNKANQFKPKNPDHEKIRDLTILALARIYTELQRFSDAESMYKKIERTSPYIDDALYELSWLYLQFGDPIKAEQSLDMLSVINPDSVYTPEAKILRGRLLLEAGRFKEAEENFKTLIEQFTPLHNQLILISQKKKDPKLYFNEIIKANIETFQIRSFIHPLVLRWMVMDEKVKNSLELLEDISKVNSYLKESKLLLVKLKTLASGENSYMIFPEYRDTYKSCEELLNSLVKLKGKLIRLEESLVGAKAEELRELMRRREQLEIKLKGLPESSEDFERLSNYVKEEMVNLKREIKALKVTVTGLQAMVNSITLYISQNRELQAKDLTPIERELELHKTAIKKYEDELEVLYNIVEASNVEALFGGEVLEELLKLRKSYEDTLKKEHQILSRSVESQYVDLIEGLGKRMEQLISNIKLLQREIVSEANKKLEILKRVLEEEEKNLASYEKEILTLREEGETVIGEIAFNRFIEVKDKFYNLILQAEVGITDVAWSEREEHLSRVKLLSKEQELMLQALDDEYNEVMDKYKKK